MYSTGSFWEKNYSTRSYMYSTGSFWRKNYSTRSYCVYIIEMQRPSPAARRHLFWTSLSLSTTVLLVPLARRIFALLFYGSRRSPGARPTGPRGQDAPGRTPPTTTNNNKVACISCLVNTSLLAGAHPRCCPACPHHIALHLALIPSHCDPPRISVCRLPQHPRPSSVQARRRWTRWRRRHFRSPRPPPGRHIWTPRRRTPWRCKFS